MPSTIAKTRNGIGRLNTRVTNENGIFAVRLYNTVVYEESQDRITLRHGGWVTPTTARRINQALAHRGTFGHVRIRNGEMGYTSRFVNFEPFTNGECVIVKMPEVA